MAHDIVSKLTSLLPFEAEADNLRVIIRWLVRLNLLVLVFLLIALLGWMQAPSSLSIDIVPGLNYGGMKLKPGNRERANVFSTAAYLFQYLNRWDNGAKDYPQKIIELSSYLTPSCYAYLNRDLAKRQRSGELTNRARYISPVSGWKYSDDLVEVRGQDEWILTLDMHVEEYLRATKIKDLNVRYPLRVVRFDVDPESNPYGLALDCFASKPYLLTEKPDE